MSPFPQPAPKGNQYAKGCKSNGRPTSYKDAYPEKTNQYIESILEANKQAEKPRVPTVAGLAVHLGHSKRSLYEWAEKHTDFLHALAKLKGVQEDLLVIHGLDNQFNSTIAKLLLSANHGYAEKKDVNMDVSARVEEQGQKLKEALDS